MKEQIIREFSRSAITYDQHAVLQNECAIRLTQLIEQSIPDLVSGPVLEIGCGTGLLTEKIIPQILPRPFLITDISSSMLEVCKNKLSAKDFREQIRFKVLDGEQIDQVEEYALIVSGMTFQWFLNFEESLARVFRTLKPGGLLIFSFLEEESFPEWHNLCLDLGIPYRGNSLPSFHNFRKLGSIDGFVHLWKESTVVQYPSLLDFLKNFKNTGTNHSIKSKSLSLSQLRLLLEHWKKSSSKEISVTYKIGYGMIKK